MLRNSTKKSVEYIFPVIEVKTSDSPETTVKRERLDCPTGRFQPIILSPHPEFEDDLASAREVTEEMFKFIDPLEPFERTERAVEVLAKQDERFR